MQHAAPTCHPQRHRLLALAVATALLCLTAEALAFGTLDDQSQSPLSTEFRKLDSNGDGRLSREEGRRDNDIALQFDKADRNHDGSLSSEEYAGFKSPLQQARLEAYLNDSTLTAKVKAELLKDNGIKGLSISVQTHSGQVILSGFVDTEQQARRAVEIAAGIRGVLNVKNSLLLKG